jgi:ribulose-phosphate 3-epimerase
MPYQILPSLLAADIGRLADEAKRAEDAGADQLHLDIMDGHFVPSLSFGPAVVEMAKKQVNIPINVHLMMTRPDQYVSSFVDAGADSLLIHVEAECDVSEELDRIGEYGVRPGITINPDTPVRMIFPVLKKVDEILCMSVFPGYGGQSFIPDVLPKIRDLRQELERQGCKKTDIMVDGGINDETGARCAEAGANLLVAGTWLFAADDMAAQIKRMRDAVRTAT